MGFQKRQWIHMIPVERAGQQMVSAILVRPSHPQGRRICVRLGAVPRQLVAKGVTAEEGAFGKRS